VKEFGYERAVGVRDAIAAVAEREGARYLGGGTNLVDLMKDEIEAPTRLVDIRRLPLSGIREEADGGLVIGATTTNTDIAAHAGVRRRYPALAQAVLFGASGQLRNMATAGGNLLQRTRCAYFTDPSFACNKREPGSGCPAITGEHRNHAIFDWSPHCAATHPSDMAVALVAFDAVVHYETLTATGDIPLTEFYPTVGETPYHETVLPPGALITSISLPKSEVAGRSRYRKIRERASYAFANASVAAALDIRDGHVREARIALGAVASRPWRARSAEAAILGAPATAASFRAAADAELSAARPLSHNGYKVTLARNLIVLALTELAEESGR
jgi:xanthine dehydrogenase YagS FAD-binding subunit